MAQDTDMTPQQGQLFSVHFHLLLCEPSASTSPGCPVSHLHSYCTHLLPGPQIRESQAPCRAVCRPCGFFRMMHGGVSAPSCCVNVLEIIGGSKALSQSRFHSEHILLDHSEFLSVLRIHLILTFS